MHVSVELQVYCLCWSTVVLTGHCQAQLTPLAGENYSNIMSDSEKRELGAAICDLLENEEQLSELSISEINEEFPHLGGMTLLHIACTAKGLGYPAVVALLQRPGIEVNLKAVHTESGRRCVMPVMLAVMLCNKESAALLLRDPRVVLDVGIEESSLEDWVGQMGGPYSHQEKTEIVRMIQEERRRRVRRDEETRGNPTIQIAICKQTFDKHQNTSLLRARFNLSEYQTS